MDKNKRAKTQMNFNGGIMALQHMAMGEWSGMAPTEAKTLLAILDTPMVKDSLNSKELLESINIMEDTHHKYQKSVSDLNKQIHEQKATIEDLNTKITKLLETVARLTMKIVLGEDL